MSCWAKGWSNSRSGFRYGIGIYRCCGAANRKLSVVVDSLRSFGVVAKEMRGAVVALAVLFYAVVSAASAHPSAVLMLEGGLISYQWQAA